MSLKKYFNQSVEDGKGSEDNWVDVTCVNKGFWKIKKLCRKSSQIIDMLAVDTDNWPLWLVLTGNFNELVEEIYDRLTKKL